MCSVSVTQFQRLVDFLNLKFSVPEVKLLAKRFTDERNGEVDYRGFVAAIDYRTCDCILDDGD